MQNEWIYSHKNACRMCNRGYDEREMYNTEVNADEVCYECYHEIAETNDDAEPLADTRSYEERVMDVPASIVKWAGSKAAMSYVMGVKVGNA